MTKLQQTSLADIGKVLMCKRVLKHQTSDYGEIPFFKISTFGDKPDTFIPKELYDNFRKKYSYPKKGDILISAAGTVGKTVVFDGQPAYFQDSNIVWIDNDESKIINNYLYYFYQTKPWVTTDGSTIKRIYNENLRSIKISFPAIIEQQKISAVLSALDSKIELNNRINAELEQMAKTLYDYWFVQFDFPNQNGEPYKTSGGKMVWNKEMKKEIPEKWCVKQMNELLKKNTVKFDFNGDNHDIDTIDLSVMPCATMCLNEKSSSGSFGTNLFKLSKFDILFGGIRPYLLKAGFSPFDGLVTGTVHSFKVKREYEYNFSLLAMTHNSMFKFAVSNSKGTKMPVIGADDLLTYKVAYNEEILKKFNNCIQFRDMIAHNIIENQKLSELRDWLLPMLMNGQVTVK